jgi:hypothetical protein
MRFDPSLIRGSISCVALAFGLSVASCAPAGDPSNTGNTGSRGGSTGSNSGGSSGSGGSTGSGGAASGGSGGSASGGSAGGGGSGGSSSSGGSTGSGGAASGGSTGSGGSGGAASGGSGGGSGGASGDAGGGDTGGGDTAGGTPTFTRVFNEILTPGCTAPNACHSIARDQYFHFAMKAQAHMLLVPTPPAANAIPMRVQTLLNQVKPTNPAMPNSVAMPPQSGANLGNPEVRKPPLTTAQVALIEAWARAGAKND